VSGTLRKARLLEQEQRDLLNPMRITGRMFINPHGSQG
jgi:hypothetical protein